MRDTINHHQHSSRGHTRPVLHSDKSVALLMRDTINHHQHSSRGHTRQVLHSDKSVALLIRDTINHHQHSSRGHSDESVALLKFREGIRAARPKVDYVDPLVLDRARHQSRHGLEPHKLARRIVVAIEPLPSKDSPLHNLMREAIRGRHQRPSPPSEAIRGHQRPSEVIRSHQRSSEVIRGHSSIPFATSCAIATTRPVRTSRYSRT